ncbi:MAG: formate/nitrite transporter family protein [Actinomycetia bacterium]|nr:formate/nitrite transporter family protein [Actinomycetes bacterium]
MPQPDQVSPMGGVEAYTPAEMARMVETEGVVKAGGALFSTFVLGVLAGKTVVDKVFAVIFGIAALAAVGFEHSIANMYFIPQGLLLKDEPGLAEAAQEAGPKPEQLASLDWNGLVTNITAVTLGNIVGGGLLVGLVHWFGYLCLARGGANV